MFYISFVPKQVQRLAVNFQPALVLGSFGQKCPKMLAWEVHPIELSPHCGLGLETLPFPHPSKVEALPCPAMQLRAVLSEDKANSAAATLWCQQELQLCPGLGSAARCAAPKEGWLQHQLAL